jgi:hypothetical protein
VGRVQGLVERLQHEGLIGGLGLVDAPEEDVGVIPDLRSVQR